MHKGPTYPKKVQGDPTGQERLKRCSKCTEKESAQRQTQVLADDPGKNNKENSQKFYEQLLLFDMTSMRYNEKEKVCVIKKST